MRRTRCIVNEMEFRMLREAKSFSPPARVETMKGFSSMHQWARRGSAPSAGVLAAHFFRRAHRTFSKAAFCRNVIARCAHNTVGHFIDGALRAHRLDRLAASFAHTS
ncbi:hypothetical protein G8O24_16280 [Bradyrhizobium sp. INPA01-394B]|uniref:Transposase n=1 Tax=Bradyrhizobium campsiandrae TaxID=1729892 RepID=A0ABR7UB76_9BRAD|nr:hypothetical protein [Bradyrhizobium campsiandrae]MBC9980841.1 hypothetical protein [Bradyrhizobium campsiandrae]